MASPIGIKLIITEEIVRSLRLMFIKSLFRGLQNWDTTFTLNLDLYM